MFEYLEPSDRDNPGTGSLPLPPRSGANDRGTRFLNPEKVRHMLYGSLAGIDRTIKILHALGYADLNDWSEPIPVPPGGSEPATASAPQTRLSSGVEMPAVSGVELWMAILTKTVLIE